MSALVISANRFFRIEVIVEAGLGNSDVVCQIVHLHRLVTAIFHEPASGIDEVSSVHMVNATATPMSVFVYFTDVACRLM